LPIKGVKKNNWLLYLLLAALGLAILCISFMDICPLLELIHPSLKINKTIISDFINGLGPWGPASSIGLMVAHSFVPFPAEFLTFANGMVYGSVWGVVITWVGAMLGAFASFALTKHYGRPFVEKKVSPAQLKKIDHWVQQQGVWSLLLARCIPIISFNLINYGAGMTSVSWWTFFWTTGIGILPITVIMVTMGNNFDIIPLWVWAIILAVIIGTAYLLNSLRQNQLKKK
jgi:uncharacterized membrane protein YdjX (TVP38/TMEM64 family)